MRFYFELQANSGQSATDFCWTYGNEPDFLSVLGGFTLPTSFDHTHIHPFISVYGMCPYIIM